MKEELITFETAVLAKEKGFDWEIQSYYDFIGDFCTHMSNQNTNKSKSSLYSAPTQALLQRWLREKHKINILTTCHQSNGSPIAYDVCLFVPYGSQSKMTPWSDVNHKTYEQALNQGLLEALRAL